MQATWRGFAAWRRWRASEQLTLDARLSDTRKLASLLRAAGRAFVVPFNVALNLARSAAFAASEAADMDRICAVSDLLTQAIHVLPASGSEISRLAPVLARLVVAALRSLSRATGAATSESARATVHHVQSVVSLLDCIASIDTITTMLIVRSAAVSVACRESLLSSLADAVKFAASDCNTASGCVDSAPHSWWAASPAAALAVHVVLCSFGNDASSANPRIDATSETAAFCVFGVPGITRVDPLVRRMLLNLYRCHVGHAGVAGASRLPPPILGIFSAMLLRDATPKVRAFTPVERWSSLVSSPLLSSIILANVIDLHLDAIAEGVAGDTVYATEADARFTAVVSEMLQRAPFAALIPPPPTSALLQWRREHVVGAGAASTTMEVDDDGDEEMSGAAYDAVRNGEPRNIVGGIVESVDDRGRAERDPEVAHAFLRASRVSQVFRHFAGNRDAHSDRTAAAMAVGIPVPRDSISTPRASASGVSTALPLRTSRRNAWAKSSVTLQRNIARTITDTRVNLMSFPIVSDQLACAVGADGVVALARRLCTTLLGDVQSCAALLSLLGALYERLDVGAAVAAAVATYNSTVVAHPGTMDDGHSESLQSHVQLLDAAARSRAAEAHFSSVTEEVDTRFLPRAWYALSQHPDFFALTSADASVVLARAPELAAGLAFFCAAVARALAAVDDADLAMNQGPMPVTLAAQLVHFCRQLLFRLAWADQAACSTHLTRRPPTVQAVLTTATRLMVHLYDRHGRRPLAPGMDVSAWLWPTLPPSELTVDVLLGLAGDVVIDNASATGDSTGEHSDAAAASASIQYVGAKGVRQARAQLVLGCIPFVVPFTTRARLFAELRKREYPAHEYHPKINVRVRRAHLVEDTFASFSAIAETGSTRAVRAEIAQAVVRDAVSHGFAAPDALLGNDDDDDEHRDEASIAHVAPTMAPTFAGSAARLHTRAPYASLLRSPLRIEFINAEGLFEAGIDGGGLMKVRAYVFSL